jgi:hypothetical protein
MIAEILLEQEDQLSATSGSFALCKACRTTFPTPTHPSCRIQRHSLPTSYRPLGSTTQGKFNQIGEKHCPQPQNVLQVLQSEGD